MHTGAGFDTYLLSDLDRMPEYKCYVFLNPLRLTDAHRKTIETKLKKNGKTLVWIHAPGILDETGIQPRRVAEITGISMKIEEASRRPKIDLAEGLDPLTQLAGFFQGL